MITIEMSGNKLWKEKDYKRYDWNRNIIIRHMNEMKRQMIIFICKELKLLLYIYEEHKWWEYR